MRRRDLLAWQAKENWPGAANGAATGSSGGQQRIDPFVLEEAMRLGAEKVLGYEVRCPFVSRHTPCNPPRGALEP